MTSNSSAVLIRLSIKDCSSMILASKLSWPASTNPPCEDAMPMCDSEFDGLTTVVRRWWTSKLLGHEATASVSYLSRAANASFGLGVERIQLRKGIDNLVFVQLLVRVGFQIEDVR